MQYLSVLATNDSDAETRRNENAYKERDGQRGRKKWPIATHCRQMDGDGGGALRCRDSVVAVFGREGK